MYQQSADAQENKSTHPNKVSGLSFLQAMRNLLYQQVEVILKPSVTTFKEAQNDAHWNVVLLQGVSLVAITFAINWVASFIPGAALHTLTHLISAHFNAVTVLPSPLSSILWVLGTFLIGLGTAYLLSKLVKGQGTFLAHTYLLFLCTLPLVTLGGISLLLPVKGVLLTILVGFLCFLLLYRLVLHIMVIIAIHRLKTGMAILITSVLPMLLLLIGLFFLTEGRILEGAGDIIPSRRNKKKIRM